MDANGLRPVGTLLDSQAVLVGGRAAVEARRNLVERLELMLSGVVAARRRRYVMMNAHVDDLPKIRALLPGCGITYSWFWLIVAIVIAIAGAVYQSRTVADMAARIGYDSYRNPGVTPPSGAPPPDPSPREGASRPARLTAGATGAGRYHSPTCQKNGPRAGSRSRGPMSCQKARC